MHDALVKNIQSLFIEKGWTLSLAESCTGGALAARLTSMPGCSNYFLGSIVAYSNEIKIKTLNIDESILNEYGAISEPVASQMANEVRKLMNSDYSLAVSGIAGPGGGTASKPVGTICAALARREESPLVWTFHLDGSREVIISQAVEALLNRLWLLIRNA